MKATAEQIKKYGFREYLCWLDIETTGLTPDAHHVIEVGALIVHHESGEEVARFDEIVPPVPPSSLYWSKPSEALHRESGLYYEVMAGHQRWGWNLIHSLRQRLQLTISQLGGSDAVELAGSSPMFDLNFLCAFDEGWRDLFFRRGSRMVDVSVFRQAGASWGLEMPPTSPLVPHRGMNDCIMEYQEFLHWKELFSS